MEEQNTQDRQKSPILNSSILKCWSD